MPPNNHREKALLQQSDLVASASRRIGDFEMSESSITFFPAPGRRLRFLEAPIRKMVQGMDRYTNHFLGKYDAAEMTYVCGERAALSQLAGGVWRADPTNFVVEEYACAKPSD